MGLRKGKGKKEAKMHSKCRWEIEDVGGRGLEFSRPTERELDFLTARLSREQRGRGDFFVHIFDQPKKSDFLKEKHMSAFRIHPQGLHFQNVTENAHNCEKGECNLRTLCSSSSSSFIRERA